MTDTLKMAKELHPRQAQQPDALVRTLRKSTTRPAPCIGALLDTELLADVFPGHDTWPEQPDDRTGRRATPNIGADGQVRERKPLTVRRATEANWPNTPKTWPASTKSKGACIWLPR